MEAATLSLRGCNPISPGLQPYVQVAALLVWAGLTGLLCRAVRRDILPYPQPYPYAPRG